MSGVDIQFEFKYPNFGQKIADNRRRIMIFMAAMLQTNRGMLFDAEGAYNGHQKWAPLKFRNGQILSKSGTLRKSIAPGGMSGNPGPDGIVRISSDIVTIGTKLHYARMMNDGTVGLPGGVLKPKYALALAIPMPGGKGATKIAKQVKGVRKKNKNTGKMEKTLLVKSVKIPPRNFNSLNEKDAGELSEGLVNICREIMLGR